MDKITLPPSVFKLDKIQTVNNIENQQQVQSPSGLKQDTFEKSNAAVKVTTGGIISGGIIGALKECLKRNPQVQQGKSLPINSIVAKFLNKETLSEAEAQLLQKIGFSDDVFSELSSALIDKLKSLCSKDSLDVGTLCIIKNEGALELGALLKEKTIARMTGKCGADENIFKLFGDDFEQIYNNIIKSHSDLLDENGFIKEYLTQALYTEMQAEKNSVGKSFIITKAGELMPDFHALQSVKSEECKNLGRTVAKNIDIKKVLKSAGVGATLVGALALGGSLIYNKVKKDKQPNQSI